MGITPLAAGLWQVKVSCRW